MRNSFCNYRKAIVFISVIFMVSIFLTSCSIQNSSIPMNMRWASVEGGQLHEEQAGEQFYFNIPVDESLIAQGIPIKLKVSGQVTSGWLRFELRDPSGQPVWDSGKINPGDFAINKEYDVPAGKTGLYEFGMVFGANTLASYNLGWYAFRLSPILLLPGFGMILVALAYIIYALRAGILGWRSLGLGALFWVLTVAVKFAFAALANPLVIRGLNVTSEHLFSPGNLLAYLYIGALTGIFEVGLAWLILSKIRWGMADWKQALVFGIGFGTVEALLLGVGGLASALVSLFAADMLPISALGTLANNGTLGMALAPVIERFSVVLAHIFSCVLIFYAIAKREGKWVWLSILYKTLLDAVAGFAAYWGLNTLIKIWTIEGVILVFGLIGLWGTLQIAKRYPGEPADQLSTSQSLQQDQF